MWRFCFVVLLFWITLSFCFPDDPLYPQQWYLHKRTQGNPDGLDLLRVWSSGLSGTDVKMSLISDGFLHTHEDLVSTYDHFDSHSVSPDAGGIFERGTGLAGLMNANANKKHIIGVAYNATLSNRIANRSSTDDVLVQCLEPREIDVLCCAWLTDKGVPYLVGPSPKVDAAFEAGVREGRGGKGSIYVIGSGQKEYSFSDQDCNFDGFATSPFTITVGGVEFNEIPERTGNVNPGTALFLVAPTSLYSSVPVVTLGSKFNSAEKNHFVDRDTPTALVSGVIALLLEANPELNWYDVQNILLMTSWPIESASGTVRNAVGLSHSRHFGFGLINPPTAIQFAQGYKPTKLPTPAYVDFFNDIPREIKNDANVNDWYLRGTPLVTDFVVRENFVVSSVELYLTVDHEYCGDLDITLLSPSGTLAKIAHPHHIFSQTEIQWLSEGRQYVFVDRNCVETQYGAKWAGGNKDVDQIVVSSVNGCGEGEDVESIFPQSIQNPFPSFGNWVMLLETSESVSCNFTERVRNAEKAGAKGVFFVNENDVSFSIDEETLEDVGIGALVIGRTGGDLLKQDAIRDLVGSLKISTQLQKNAVDPFDNWRMLDLVHWGESSAGLWKVLIRDDYPDQDPKENFLNFVKLRFHKAGLL